VNFDPNAAMNLRGTVAFLDGEIENHNALTCAACVTRRNRNALRGAAATATEVRDWHLAILRDERAQVAAKLAGVR
jgi:hypothetical protein